MMLKGGERGCEAAGRVGRGWDNTGISKEELKKYLYIYRLVLYKYLQILPL